MIEAITFRPLVQPDQASLWTWLHIALWDPPPAPLRPREVLDRPDIRRLAEHWGGTGDIGMVAVVDGHAAGACWMRTLSGGEGFANVNDVTPQLGIALEPQYRGRGIGKRLMTATLARAWEAGIPSISLTVHPENPAIAMYRSCGFDFVELRHTYHLMLAKKPESTSKNTLGATPR